MRYKYTPYMSSEPERLFPFRTDNRRPDGFWDVEDATQDNIRGTSVDPSTPVWPRWRETPPLHGEGAFISHAPFFDIDEITQRADFYRPGRPLVDRNVDGHPASRQRVNDSDAGNLWRRRLLLARSDPFYSPGGHYEAPSEVGPDGIVDDRGTLSFAVGRKAFQLVGGTQQERSNVEASVRRVVSSPWTRTEEGRRALANLLNRPGVQTLDLSARRENRTLPPGNYNYVNPRRFPVYRTLLGGRVAPLDRVVAHELMGHTGGGHSDFSTTTATDVENAVMQSLGDRADRGKY